VGTTGEIKTVGYRCHNYRSSTTGGAPQLPATANNTVAVQRPRSAALIDAAIQAEATNVRDLCSDSGL
jgi:hypothetical protein